MFREVIKKKNEISIEEGKELLRTSRRGVLAVNGDDGYPYAIPINYLFDEVNNKIIFHGSKKGHKIDSINKNDKICFTVYGIETIKSEEWAPFVKSVVVFGRCHLIENKDESNNQLKKFATKYYPSEEMVENEIMYSGANVQMFEITIEHISGKEVQEK